MPDAGRAAPAGSARHQGPVHAVAVQERIAKRLRHAVAVRSRRSSRRRSAARSPARGSPAASGIPPPPARPRRCRAWSGACSGQRASASSACVDRDRRAGRRRAHGARPQTSAVMRRPFICSRPGFAGDRGRRRGRRPRAPAAARRAGSPGPDRVARRGDDEAGARPQRFGGSPRLRPDRAPLGRAADG